MSLATIQPMAATTVPPGWMLEALERACTTSEKKCEVCGNPWPHKNPRAKLCPDCRKRRRRSGERPTRLFVCLNPSCQMPFAARIYHKNSPPKFCSFDCRPRIIAGKRHVRLLLQLKEARRLKRIKACVRCGSEYDPVKTGTLAPQACPTCYSVWKEERRAARIEKTKARRAALVSPCQRCGEGFTPCSEPCGQRSAFGPLGKYCHDCRAIDDRIEKYGTAYEYVNPCVVFRRDGWRCQHCGCATPESLVGNTKLPKTPTLDHILPFARGGAHSYANTQLLCRACNSRKSASIKLEPKLVGVVDYTPFQVARNPAKAKSQKPKKCACGCKETFIPFLNGNAEYKSGHWNRTTERRVHLSRTNRRYRELLDLGMLPYRLHELEWYVPTPCPEFIS